ncbi:putative MFS family arabinose efflux permease [Novosphingobium hassiacum]|uniref:Putative MFS family arabinose efflux permease n=1 Tax=Novosphingobium hassiacum TaxID=173676 RepID=A0A7W6EX99_9SPHN|nr:MFS transporter [Novosphingobium hassiacum]MBB3862158.1 putative MFS family arabinose efflux permease [Novosphingobium hassiacum]
MVRDILVATYPVNSARQPSTTKLSAQACKDPTLTQTPTPAAGSEFDRSTAWMTLLMLTGANVLMSLDRTIPQLVAEPVKREFGLSDGQLGMFIGLAFGVSYGVAGLLLGPVIDRYSRRNFIAAVLAIWSTMTFMTGFAVNYVMLLLTRGALGAAEAGGNPASISIISDVFPPAKRSSAIGVYKVGVPLGILLASGLTGWLATAYGWRAVFFAGGLPGLLLSILIFWRLREPSRGQFDAETPAGTYQAASYRSALAFVFSDRRMAPFALALLLSVFAGAPLSAFGASLLQRNHGFSLQQVGLFTGIGSALALVSPFLVGLLADRMVQKGQHRLFLLLSVLSFATLAAAVGMLVAHEAVVVVICFVGWQFLSLGLTTPGMAAVIALTPVGMRGTLVALISVGNMCIGFGLGPLAVGYASDMIGGANSLGIALLIVTGSGYVIATALFLLTARSAQRLSLMHAPSSTAA